MSILLFCQGGTCILGEQGLKKLMANKEISLLFLDMAFYMELKGENPFKVRAFSHGAKVLREQREEVEELLKAKKLGQLKGIGRGLAAAIEEYVSSGKIEELESLRKEFPPQLIELRSIAGLGAKKIKVLFRELGVASLSELEYACVENRLLDLKGFGKKSQANVLKGIRHLKLNRGRCLLPHGMALSRQVQAVVRGLPGIKNIYEMGELRRKREVISTLDFLVELKTKKNISWKKLETLGIVPTTFASLDFSPCFQGKTEEGIKVQLFPWTGESTLSMGATQLYLTGSSRFISFLERKGKIPNENTEEAIFKKLKVPWIPPEVREEVVSTVNLVGEKDIQGLFHAHTTASDGANSLREMAEKCRELGFSYLGVSEHSQSATYASGLKLDDIKRQREEVRELNASFKDFYIFHGIESDIRLDGSLDYPDELLAQFDFIIASVHSSFQMNKKDMTRRLCAALKNPFSTWLGHPTGRILLGRKGYDFDMEKVLDAAAKFGKGVELNSNPYRLDLDWRFLSMAKARKVPVGIFPDAHNVAGLEDYKYGVWMARKGGLEKKNISNTKNLQEMKKWLAQKR